VSYNRLLASVADAVWVYVIPAAFVINVFQFPLEWVLVAIIGSFVLLGLALALYAALFSIQWFTDILKQRFNKGGST
jgi:hypothetical protein